MFQDVKKNVRNIYNNFQSYTEVYKNFKVINSYKSILKNKFKNNNLKFKNILIDGGFYNLGYLYRLQLLRAALYSKEVNEYAFIWDCNKFLCKNILNSIGIRNISYLNKYYSNDLIIESELISKNIKKKIDIIN